MEKVYTTFQMEMFISDNSIKIILKDKEFTASLKVKFMRAKLKMAKNKDMVINIIQMEISIKDISKMDLDKDQEVTDILALDKNIKANGDKTIDKVLEHIFLHMVINTKEIG